MHYSWRNASNFDFCKPAVLKFEQPGSGCFEEQPPNGKGGEGVSLRGEKMDYGPPVTSAAVLVESPGGPSATCI